MRTHVAPPPRRPVARHRVAKQQHDRRARAEQQAHRFEHGRGDHRRRGHARAAVRVRGLCARADAVAGAEPEHVPHTRPPETARNDQTNRGPLRRRDRPQGKRRGASVGRGTVGGDSTIVNLPRERPRRRATRDRRATDEQIQADMSAAAQTTVWVSTEIAMKEDARTEAPPGGVCHVVFVMLCLANALGRRVEEKEDGARDDDDDDDGRIDGAAARTWATCRRRRRSARRRRRSGSPRTPGT